MNRLTLNQSQSVCEELFWKEFLPIFLKMYEKSKCSYFDRKTESFQKYSSTDISPAVSAWDTFWNWWKKTIKQKKTNTIISGDSPEGLQVQNWRERCYCKACSPLSGGACGVLQSTPKISYLSSERILSRLLT